MNCVFCGNSEFEILFKAPGFDEDRLFFELLICKNCNVVHTEPMLDHVELDTYYRHDYYGSSEKKFHYLIERFVIFNNYLRARKIYSLINKKKLPIRILDVGCGRALLLSILSRFGCECHGIERNGFVFPNNLDKLLLYTQPLDKIGFNDDFFDAVIVWHSLEHMDNPAAILQEIHRIIKPNGLIVISAPNFNSTQQRIFKHLWFHLDLPRHTYHLAVNSMVAYLSGHGFRIKLLSTYSFEQNIYGFIQSSMNLIPWTKTNSFYSMLKPQGITRRPIQMLLFWILLTILFLPIAFLENLISGLVGFGATFSIYAFKRQQ